MNKRSMAVLVLSSFASAAMASPRCDQETLQGSWVYTCEGTIPAPTQTAARLLGRCTASRTGYFNCEGNFNLGGSVLANTLQGQSNTNANCTGRIVYSVTLAGKPAAPLDIQYVVSERGDAINGLPTNTGGVLSCRLARIGGGQD